MFRKISVDFMLIFRLGQEDKLYKSLSKYQKGNYYFCFGSFLQDRISNNYQFPICTNQIQEQAIFSKIITQSNNNQSIIHGSYQRQPVHRDKQLQFPFCSIGQLCCSINYRQKLYGTATIIFDKQRQKFRFLITCAHNFYSKMEDKSHNYFIFDYRFNPERYSFQLPSRQIPEQPDRYMAATNLQTCKISKQKVFIFLVNKIKDAIQHESLNRQLKQIIENAQKNARHFDIAIVQLSEEIIVTKGFRLNLFEKPFSPENSNIQVTGFPTTGYFHTISGKQYTSSTSDYTGGRRPIVVLQNRSQQGIIIKHKLSTLPGNSGSPVYQKTEDKKSVYLLGVHTGGERAQSNINTNAGSIESQFLRLKDQSFGYKKVQFHESNVGTYLYSPKIYSWYLTLPGIHNVTEHYSELVSRIAILQLGGNNGQYGMGFLTDSSHITFSSSYNSVNRVIIKKYSEMSMQNNILEFNLQQQSNIFHHITQKGITQKYGLKRLEIDSIQALIGTTKHVSEVEENQCLTIEQSVGLKVILSQNMLNLVLEQFEARKIFDPLNLDPSTFYIVYNFENNTLIWAAK